MPRQVVEQALEDACAEGYTVAGFSGGEPLLYRPLSQVLAVARGLGMVTTVTTNGMFLDERRLEDLAGVVDLIAISLDGVPASHNRMRASPRAFDAMASRLDGVRAAGIPFGFIFTLTQHNLDELAWVVAFARGAGAKILQVHPLEDVGRARQRLPEAAPDGLEFGHTYLEALRLQAQAADELLIHLDILDRELIAGAPQRVFADRPRPDADQSLLASLVSPIVVEADGTVVPIQYGFPRQYALGRLEEGRLSEFARKWRQTCFGMFRDLTERVFQELLDDTALPFVNWYEVLSRRAEAVLEAELGADH